MRYNPTVFRRTLTFAILLAGAACAAQQEPPAQQQPSPAPQQPEGKPQVKINYMNVCTPGKEDQEVINGALAAIPAKPAFSPDFEIARGHTTMKDAPDSKFVRLRRDFAPESPLMTAQFSMSTDPTNTVEILVLRMRDPKEFHEIAIEDRVSAGAAAPAAVLSVDTPASRVRIERLGKSSAGLSRCQETDQSAYDPVFRRASEILAQYRAAMGLRTMFRSDIAWLGSAPEKTSTTGQKMGAVRKKQAARKP
jgi:hypothetical protein